MIPGGQTGIVNPVAINPAPIIPIPCVPNYVPIVGNELVIDGSAFYANPNGDYYLEQGAMQGPTDQTQGIRVLSVLKSIPRQVVEERGALGTRQPTGAKRPTAKTATQKKPPAKGPGFVRGVMMFFENLFAQKSAGRLIQLAKKGNKRSMEKLCQKAKTDFGFVESHITELLELAKTERVVAFLINRLINERPTFFDESHLPGVVEVAKVHFRNTILARLPKTLAAKNEALANGIIAVLSEKMKNGDSFAASSLPDFAPKHPEVTKPIADGVFRDDSGTATNAALSVIATSKPGESQIVFIGNIIKRMNEGGTGIAKVSNLLRKSAGLNLKFIGAFIDHLIDSAKDAGEAKDQIVSLAKAQQDIAPQIMSATIEKVKISGLKGKTEKTAEGQTAEEVTQKNKAGQVMNKIIEENPDLLSADNAEALLRWAGNMGRPDMAELAIKWIEGQKSISDKFVKLLIDVADISDKALPELKREAINAFNTGNHEISNRIIADLSAATVNNPKIAVGAAGELLSLAKDLKVESPKIVRNLIEAAKESKAIASQLKNGIEKGEVCIESSHVDTLVEGVKANNPRMGRLLQTYVKKGSEHLDMQLKKEHIDELGNAAAEGNFQAAQILKTSALVNRSTTLLCIVALIIAASKNRIPFDVLRGLIDGHPGLFALVHKKILDRLDQEKAAEERGPGAIPDENSFARVALRGLREKRPDLFEEKEMNGAK